MTKPPTEGAPGGRRVCPASRGGLLATSLRRLLHKPEGILDGLVRPGQTVADLGCGPGFFTIPMARMVGDSGQVIAVDLQAAMLSQLHLRAVRAGVAERIEPHQCAPDALGLDQTVDFALAFYMVHEVPDVPAFLAQVHGLLAPDGRFLMVEPVFHVSATGFRKTVDLARAAGLKPLAEPRIVLSRSVLLGRA